MNRTEPFPNTKASIHGMLKVDEIHSIYWEESGNKKGVSVVLVHGGPGFTCPPEARTLFDPDFYRIICFDQRGAGRSVRFAEIQNNTPQHLISDIEALRKHLDVNNWLI